MSNGQQHPKAKDERATLRILWIAMITSHLVIIGVTSVVPRAEPTDDLLALLMLGAVLPCGALSLAWGRLFGRDQPAMTRWIMRWAFAEACTVFGLASWSAAGELVATACSMLAGLLLVVLQWPREER